MFLQTFRQFLENWIFDGKSNRHPRTLQKWWKFCNISNMLRIFFLAKYLGKILSSTHQKKCFYKLLGSFFDGKSTAADLTKMVKILKIEFLTENRQPRTLQNWWKFCTISNVLRKYFFGKILCSTHQKKCFYKKMVKICTISKCAKKIFFGKILCSTHQKKCFYKLLGSFWKIEFLTENRQPRTLQKWWKFCSISKKKWANF